jgi:hypothetical protein
MRKKKPTAAAPITREMEELLVYGPFLLGKKLTDLPPHDEMRAAWAVHGAGLTATMPRGKVPWFVDRDWFVSLVRGETALDGPESRRRRGQP